MQFTEASLQVLHGKTRNKTKEMLCHGYVFLEDSFSNTV